MRVVHFKLLLASILFGSYLVTGKLILREVPVFTAGFMRRVSAAVFLAAFLWLTKALPTTLPGRRDRVVLVSQALIGIFLFNLFAMYGVSLTGAIEAGVILGMVPITVTLIAVVLLRERLALARRTGIALAVAGAIGVNVLSSHGTGAGAGPHAALGALLLVGAVMCEAVFVTFRRLLVAPISPAALSLVLAVLGAGLLAVPAGIETDWAAR